MIGGEGVCVCVCVRVVGAHVCAGAYTRTASQEEYVCIVYVCVRRRSRVHDVQMTHSHDFVCLWYSHDSLMYHRSLLQNIISFVGLFWYSDDSLSR